MKVEPVTSPSPPTPSINDSMDSGIFSNKNMLIFILGGFLLLSILGINLFSFAGILFQSVGDFFKPVVIYILTALGYTSGTLINDSADIAADVAKGGIDIADGVAHSIGNLLKNATPPSQDNSKAPNVVNAVNQGLPKYAQDAAPDNAASSIQNPIVAAKQNWCLIGEMGGQRGCVSVEDAGKCMSGQVYPTQKLCLNPTFTQNSPYG
jgi:uncharacterized membrane protein